MNAKRYEVWTDDGLVEFETKDKMLAGVFYLVKRRGESVRVVDRQTGLVATLEA